MSEANPRRPRFDFWVPAAIAGLAFFLRTHYARDQVFTAFGTRFQGVDAWYHLRLIDNLVANFPHRMQVDPYRLFPGVHGVGLAPMLDYLVAGLALAAGGGAPGPELVEWVAAYVPAVLGAGTCVLAYFIGRRLDGRFAGFVAAGLVALTAGPFLARSMLGFTDHHVAEVFFSTLTILAFATAFDAEGRVTIRRALLAGAALGAYLLSWRGGFVLIVVIGAWAATHYVVEVSRGGSGRSLLALILPAATVAIAMVLLLQQIGAGRFRQQVVGLALLPVMLLFLEATRLTADRLRVPRRAFPFLATGATIAIIAIALAFPSPFLRLFRSDLRRLALRGPALSIGEARPLLWLSGSLSLEPVWQEFRTGLIAAIAAAPLLGWRYLKRGRAVDLLILAWGGATLVLTLGQNRFGYYLTIGAALLAGSLCARLWRAASGDSGPAAERRWVVAVLVVVGLLLPDVAPALRMARRVTGPSRQWYEALEWMRDNTPEPFGSADYYDALYDDLRRGAATPQAGRPNLPGEPYGVMNWWDQGYWITRIAHRVPSANPTQGGARRVARFFAATDEQAARQMIDDPGIRYVIADNELPVLPRDDPRWPVGKLGAIAAWARRPESDFYEIFYEDNGRGRLDPVIVFYPAYYRTMAVRLALFGGRRVPAINSTWVISWEEIEIAGDTIKKIVESRRFRTYEDAITYQINFNSPNVRIVGRDPLRSCVPLDELAGYRLIYESAPQPGERLPVPAVRIFEVVD